MEKCDLNGKSIVLMELDILIPKKVIHCGWFNLLPRLIEAVGDTVMYEW